MPKNKSFSQEGATGVFEQMDLLVGAEAIALFMFGNSESTRRVYHIWEGHDLPAFKVGQALWARKSAIEAWVKAKESDGEASTDVPRI